MATTTKAKKTRTAPKTRTVIGRGLRRMLTLMEREYRQAVKTGELGLRDRAVAIDRVKDALVECGNLDGTTYWS